MPTRHRSSPAHRGTMAFDEMHRRQRAIARDRRVARGEGKRKFSLLLANISVPDSPTVERNRSRTRCLVLSLAPFLLGLWFTYGRGGGGRGSLLARTSGRTSTVRNKYWRAHVNKFDDDDEEEADKNSKLAKLANSSRPFNYIGDYDPGEPKPWMKEEKDWWALHENLVQDVLDSDSSPPLKFDIDQDGRLPQLVFYGDSITEGWRGTTFGNLPGKHRMWAYKEDEQIRDIFSEAFGEESIWGKRSLKPPLVLGISGSRTYDFIWRIQNGEFPTSRLLEGGEEEGEAEDDVVKNTFQLDGLERIYIVLMGTNNLGGGMLPSPTVEGMDAVGRAIFKLHADKFPNSPLAMLFSELLPRRDDFRVARMCPPRCKNETTLEPFKSFMPAIEKVNAALPEIVEGWRSDYENSRIVLLSGTGPEHESEGANSISEDQQDDDYQMTVKCGREMFAIDDMDEFDSFMPDRLHPNARGYELWSRCLRRGLEVIMDHSIDLEVVDL